MLEDLIEEVIYNDRPKTDVDLILAVWRLEGLNLTAEQERHIKEKCTHPETIRRTRQKLDERIRNGERTGVPPAKLL